MKEIQYSNSTDHLNHPTDEIIVTYCTIGYRSGLEARRLKTKYNLNVMNLDGIVSYTHAAALHQESFSHLPAGANTSSEEGTGAGPVAAAMGEENLLHNKYLIDPKTNKATKRVHVFGSSLSHVSGVIRAEITRSIA